MCNALKPCVEGSGEDCEDCLKYSKNVFSPDRSFRNFEGNRCDCIMRCGNRYLLVEIKSGRLDEEDIEKAVKQLENCERLLVNLCGTQVKSCKKILLYGKLDKPLTEIKKLISKSNNILFYRIGSIENSKINLCKYIPP